MEVRDVLVFLPPLIRAPGLSPLTRTWVINALHERYQRDVQLKNLALTLWPHPRISGEGLVLQPEDRPGFLHWQLSNDSVLKPTYWDFSTTLGTSAI
jgi:hypothetical protein